MCKRGASRSTSCQRRAKSSPAAPVVKHQEARQHTVIDSGVYGVVRHPMYTGAVPLLVGMPLWLESYAAAIRASVPIGTLVVRILVEEQFLRRELAGYDAYRERVRYRLISCVWYAGQAFPRHRHAVGWLRQRCS